jgi:hypothetical protein
MNDAPDYDPIRKSWRESNIVDAAWLKNGETLTWIQRIGFPVVSFCPFTLGLFFATTAVGYLRHGDWFSLESMAAAIGLVAGLLFLILGILGLRNVLRFKKDQTG